MKKKTPKGAEPTVQVLKTERQLLCPLTPGEHKKAEKALAEASVKKAEAEMKIRALKAELSAELSTATREIRNATFEMTSGRYKPVACEEIKNFQAKTYKMVRLDTGETIEDRELMDWEMQPDLEGEQVEGEAENAE